MIASAIASVAAPTAAGKTGAAAQAASGATSLRSADWCRVLTNDPDLEKQDVREVPPPLGPLWVRARDSQGGGHPLFDNIQSADLDGDGVEEAVISLESGGTAGMIGLLVYRQSPSGPRLAASLDGYKTGTRLDNGRLVIAQPVYAGWEGNCCPSSTEEAQYRLQGGQLAQVPGTRRPIPFEQAKVGTVEQFYGC